MTVNQGEADTRLATQLTGSDPELSKKAETLNDGEYLPRDYVMGRAVTGLTINVAFNRGVEHGPWKASDMDLQQYVDEGWTRDEALAYLDLCEKVRRIGANTYPFGATGELAAVVKSLNDEARKIGHRVEERLN